MRCPRHDCRFKSDKPSVKAQPVKDSGSGGTAEYGTPLLRRQIRSNNGRKHFRSFRYNLKEDIGILPAGLIPEQKIGHFRMQVFDDLIDALHLGSLRELAVTPVITVRLDEGARDG